MELQVRHLRVLLAIARAGSLNRAAGELRLAQPALSHQLRRIEQLVGDKLFDRGPHGVRPTRIGRLLLARAEAIIPAFDELDRDFRRQQPAHGHVRIGWNDSALASDVFHRVRQLLPGSELTTRSDLSHSRLVTQVASGCVDLALAMICGQRSLAVPDGLRAERVVAEPSFVAMPSTHRLAAAPVVDLADLAEERWIVSSCGDGCRIVFREMCLAHGFTPRIAHDVDTLRFGLVRGGHGVCLVQPTTSESAGTAIRPLAGNPMTVQHILVWRADHPSGDRFDAVHRAAVDDYARLTAESDRYRRWLDNDVT
ncbi:LysR family transcriptional regulator [Kibdelosporangium phytohabitans]|uniref:LysR family transcriptional regulator n=1 Tax=Kibdelosporangium phytohabitans TaxID=860235 RepID=A0A0N9HWM6_9PSEU|nr:LysR family transcriptional regulator [Kibdelosporangium phytohabitans]ALG09678.1 LysR family transcriptional regulator [Kibdelosporangium phytohabitans]MBE1468974.1 DNA-binding transcriptional LysR family regulator [Kibdelosporangium phytohabitans]